jgi:thiol:disulfide interchange protein
MKRLLMALAMLLVISMSARAAQPGAAQAAAAKPAAAKPPVYDESADATKDVAAAITRATRENKRVLLQIGGNWCPWCRLLHDLFAENAPIATLLRNEYEVVNVDIGHGEKNKELLAKYAVKAKGYPYLAVLDANDKLVTQQETGALEDGPKHDPKKVIAFLTQWQAPAADAQKTLDEALAKASADGKRVFLRFGAPWCIWCHRLDDVLNQPAVAAALAADFIVIKIDVDRMTGGKEVNKKYQSTGGGIPWFAVLTPDGKAAMTSDIKPGSNVGFPTEPAEIEHVMKMLTGARKNMSEAQAAALREAFEKGAAAVKQPAGR